MRVQVRVQKKYFFEFKFEFGKMIEFFRVQVRVRSPDAHLLYSVSAPSSILEQLHQQPADQEAQRRNYLQAALSMLMELVVVVYFI